MVRRVIERVEAHGETVEEALEKLAGEMALIGPRPCQLDGPSAVPRNGWSSAMNTSASGWDVSSRPSIGFFAFWNTAAVPPT